MEGASGPGVGSARTVVQAGCVGTMMLGMAGEVPMGVGEELQAVRKVRSRKKEGKRKEGERKEEGLRMLVALFKVDMSRPFI